MISLGEFNLCVCVCVCGTVIGFEETEYEVVERRESYQFTLAVVQGSLAQNLTLTIISIPITAGIAATTLG